MLTQVTRIKALEAGWYESHRGRLVLRTMHDQHLINAILHSLGANDPAGIVLPLAAEVDRRGLHDQAMAEAARRMNQ